MGPNGAGKTTSLRMLAGLFQPDAGRIEVDGIDVLREPRPRWRAWASWAMPMACTRASRRAEHRLLRPPAGLSQEQAEARSEALSDLLDLKKVIDRRAEGFSQGERMKTALARALVHDPANIVLDEPTNGLDVLATRSRGPARAGPRAGQVHRSPRTSCKRSSTCATRWWW
ncbi:MAG: ATP-binding cassette domain-containing protein [Inhella sp.]